ncbi:nuclear transport factor 2 family protein [Azospirillum thermophilum]|uniref:Nuclear transport factor 2 family protein n=1 Tax=Azospirillum thermophilum TaxID=2202148 RepID=A0A2S2CLS7_9PROT|nr:nuclear transport factor 2 family protein [Azospirillum thermophilum]AWK85463.1 nuclear transport factor 2 family protein [Azospirillum thermophilum]
MDPVPEIVQRYLAAYNAQDVEAMLACLTDDVRFENLSDGTVTAATAGKEAFARLARQSAGLFSEREQVVEGCIAAGPRVALRIRYSATVAADLPNGWKAGQQVGLQGASFLTLRDGLIAELMDIS